MQEGYKLRERPEEFKVIEQQSYNLREKGDYLIFRLTKIGHTTEDAVQLIAKALNINRKNIGYAGAKDSNAVTTQNISIRGTQKETVLRLEIKNITLEFSGFLDRPISLGDLDGNSFEIMIRNTKSLPKKISKMLNLFGEQRFGTNNAEVGKCILKKEFRKAVELISSTSNKDRSIIEAHLEKNKNDYVGAIKTIPWKTLTMYIHALQSKIWNEAAREYVAQEDQEIEVLPIVGFATEYKTDGIRDIFERILEKEGISQQEFITRAIPGLTSAGDERKIYVDIKNLKISELEDDELNQGMKKCQVTFFLGKGSYATQAIREMMS